MYFILVISHIWCVEPLVAYILILLPQLPFRLSEWTPHYKLGLITLLYFMYYINDASLFCFRDRYSNICCDIILLILPDIGMDTSKCDSFAIWIWRLYTFVLIEFERYWRLWFYLAWGSVLVLTWRVSIMKELCLYIFDCLWDGNIDFYIT